MQDFTQNKQAALDLASNGFMVFPCQHADAGSVRAKSPVPWFKWKDDCSNIPDSINGWWSKWPNAAVGLAVGKSGLVVIDCDVKDGIDGIGAFGDLLSEHDCDLNSIPVVATPSGGAHFFFKAPEGVSFTNSSGSLPDNIDVRGENGFVVAPGTMLGQYKSGNRIIPAGGTYDLAGDLSEAPFMPNWLVDIIKAKKTPVTSTASYDASLPDTPITDDELKDLLYSVSPDCGYQDWLTCLQAIHYETGGSSAGLSMVDQWSSGGSKYKGSEEMARKWSSFQGSGVTKGSLAEVARQHGADLSQIGKDHFKAPEIDAATLAENQLAADNIKKAFEVKQQEVTDNPSIYLETADEEETLGGATERIDAPIDILNPPGVVGEITDWICKSTSEPIRIHAVGAALVICSNMITRKVYTKTKPTSPHIYVGIIAPSGAGKQHPQDAIRLAIDSTIENNQNNKPRHMGWNVSLPSLVSNLRDCPSKIMIVDEFADKLSGIKGRNASTFQSAISEGLRTLWGINEGSYAPDASLAQGSEPIHKPALSVFGASTVKDFTKSLSSTDVTNGLFNRFLILPQFSYVEMKPELEGSMKLPQNIKNQLKWMDECLKKQGDVAHEGTQDPKIATENPIMVPFTDEADRYYWKLRQYQRDMTIKSDDDQALALYGRYAEQIKRIALIISCGRSPEYVAKASITVDDLKFAEKLVNYSLEQFVLMVRRDMVENDLEAKRVRVLELIRKKKKVTKSYALRQIRGIYSRELDEVAKLLEDAHLITMTHENTTGGRPKVTYHYYQG